MFYSKSELKKALFFDIETASKYATFKEFQAAEPEKADIWLRKLYFKNLEKELKFIEEQSIITGDPKGDWNDLATKLSTGRDFSFNYIYVKYAALYAEFGKVISISVGFIGSNETVAPGAGEVTSISDPDEASLLATFKTVLVGASGYTLAGFNITNFDIPFLIKKMLAYKMDLPSLLALKGKKPWEVHLLDVMKDYQGLSYEPITLDLLCHTMGVKTPKDLVQNYQVSLKFHSGELTIEQVNEYCNKDVRALMDVAIALS